MPKNISFDPNDEPVTVNMGFFELPQDWSTSLLHTPFGVEDAEGACSSEDEILPDEDGEMCVLPDYCATTLGSGLQYAGSGSGWLTTSAPISPGEIFQLTFSIHDEADAVLDSTVLIDDFRWLSYEPAVTTLKEP